MLGSAQTHIKKMNKKKKQAETIHLNKIKRTVHAGAREKQKNHMVVQLPLVNVVIKMNQFVTLSRCLLVSNTGAKKNLYNIF